MNEQTTLKSSYCFQKLTPQEMLTVHLHIVVCLRHKKKVNWIKNSLDEDFATTAEKHLL